MSKLFGRSILLLSGELESIAQLYTVFHGICLSIRPVQGGCKSNTLVGKFQIDDVCKKEPG